MKMVGAGPDAGSYYDESDPGEPTTGNPRLSVTDQEAEILASLAQGRTVLEFGTGLGVSTRAMAETAATLVTVDVDPWVKENIWPKLPKGVVTMDPDEGLAGMYDMVFIDGDHSAAGVRADFERAMDHVRLRGLIVAHDVRYVNVQAGLRLDNSWWILPTTHNLGLKWV